MAQSKEISEVEQLRADLEQLRSQLNDKIDALREGEGGTGQYDKAIAELKAQLDALAASLAARFGHSLE